MYNEALWNGTPRISETWYLSVCISYRDIQINKATEITKIKSLLIL